jgi:hypothetical protein
MRNMEVSVVICREGTIGEPLAIKAHAGQTDIGAAAPYLLVLDDTVRLQVFNPERRRLLNRRDLGLSNWLSSFKGTAWSGAGELVIANGIGSPSWLGAFTKRKRTETHTLISS